MEAVLRRKNLTQSAGKSSTGPFSASRVVWPGASSSEGSSTKGLRNARRGGENSFSKRPLAFESDVEDIREPLEPLRDTEESSNPEKKEFRVDDAAVAKTLLSVLASSLSSPVPLEAVDSEAGRESSRRETRVRCSLMACLIRKTSRLIAVVQGSRASSQSTSRRFW